MREELLKRAKPILFNTEMVQAILEGRKTVTRRTIPRSWFGQEGTDKTDSSFLYFPDEYGDYHHAKDLCRYQPGDILYVRETWTQLCRVDENGYTHFDDVITYYRADGTPDIDLYDADGFLLDDQTIKWKPSIHMPKSLARIFLKVTDVRVERLQDITEEQAINEGVGHLFLDYIAYSGDEKYNTPTEHETLAIAQFELLWNSTIKKQDLSRYGWDANPWVWVIEFERVEI